MEKIGVLTSGGDSPGMNAALRSVVRKGISMDLKVKGIRHGFAGLIKGDVISLEMKDVSGIMDRGGTVLQSRRCEEFKTDDGQEKALKRLEEHEIEGLIVIGGDGSFRGGQALHEKGLPVVGIPATIDNDIYGTEIAIGVDTALNTVVHSINMIRDTATSHERAFVIEVMGRESGYIALMSGLAGGAEEILVPELDFDLDDVARNIVRGQKRGKQHSIIVAAEGVLKNAGHTVANYIERKIGYEVRVTVLGHLQRGGSPTAFDRILSSRLGAKAVEELRAGKSGVMIAWQRGAIKTVRLSEMLDKGKEINEKLYELAKVLSK